MDYSEKMESCDIQLESLSEQYNIILEDKAHTKAKISDFKPKLRALDAKIANGQKDAPKKEKQLKDIQIQELKLNNDIKENKLISQDKKTTYDELQM